MAKKKYKRKPEQWFCVQFTGSNQNEIIADYPGHITWDQVNQHLLLDAMIVVQAGSWVMQDNYGLITAMPDEKFKAYFDLDQGGPP